MPDLGWILDNLPLGVWVARAPDGVVAYSNPAFEEILGIPAVPNSPIEDAPATYNIFDRAGTPYLVEKLPFSRALAQRARVTVDDAVIHRPDGRHVNIRAFGVPMFDERGEITHVIVAFADATKEVAAELARDTMETRLALAVNHAPIVIWTADKDGIVGLSEGAGLASMGVKSGQLVGQNLFDLYRDHPTIPGSLRRGLSGEAFWYTVEVPGAIYDTYLTPLRDAEGTVAGVAALSNDVTELRRLQASAIQNDRVIALGTLAASVAHEINNPLTYLLSHAETCERRLERLEQAVAALPGDSAHPLRPLVNQLRADLDPVRSAGERIARITRQLKTFSRSSDERREVIDMKDVVRSVLALVGKDVEACAKIRLELEDRVYVFADEARLVQVVLNLVVNAKQAVQAQKRADGRIAIRAYRQTDNVLLDVEDNGPGVPAHHRDQIFDPFFTTKEPGEGTGLGLFVCRNIVRELGGDISVEGRPGEGARFRITLAAHGDAPSSVPAARPSSIPASPLERARIMLIDDEPLLLRALSQALRNAGHEVTPLDDGAAALEILLSNRPFDLIFCDVMMRGLTGIDLLRALKERAPERVRRIVFMSGGAYTTEAREFLDEYSAQSVDKPFDPVREARARLQRLAEDSS
jgi:two-component system, cell cycle sensor histidine kinase and response regulator CckA